MERCKISNVSRPIEQKVHGRRLRRPLITKFIASTCLKGPKETNSKPNAGKGGKLLTSKARFV